MFLINFLTRLFIKRDGNLQIFSLYFDFAILNIYYCLILANTVK